MEVNEVKLSNILKDRILCFDGAMGTLLIDEGIPENINLSTLNMTEENKILSIHHRYVTAGADVITTNTFTANSYSLKGYPFSAAEVVKKGVQLARSVAEEKPIALDIGPTGFIKSAKEDLDFMYLYDVYKEQITAGTEAGADIILIETMYDIREARIAILAAKENSSLPVICTLTFGSNYKTINGTDPKTAVYILQGLGIDAVGINCVDPEKAAVIIEEMLKYSELPLIVQPNAGMPKLYKGNYVYNISKESFAEAVSALAVKGVRIVGGCCGTTPEYIKSIKESIKNIPPLKTFPQKITCICSLGKTVAIGNNPKIVSNGINMEKNEILKEALKNKNFDKIESEAAKSEASGAHVLLISIKNSGVDELKVLPELINKIQNVIDLPLMIESSEPEAIEAALRCYNGKALVSGAGISDEYTERLLPIIKKYGSAYVGALENSAANSGRAENKVKAADSIIKLAKSYGISEEDIIFDCRITNTLKSKLEVFETLKTIKMINTKYNTKTILNIDDICNETGKTEDVNNVFYAIALYSGVNMAIIDIHSKKMLQTYSAYNILTKKIR